MSSRTIFLSRLIGLYCILVALSMITRKQATLESVTAVLRDPSMMFVLGAITLVAGLAMVLAHNIWSGGALAVIVTLVGWMTLIMSLSFLFLSPEVEAGLSRLFEQALSRFTARTNPSAATSGRTRGTLMIPSPPVWVRKHPSPPALIAMHLR